MQILEHGQEHGRTLLPLAVQVHHAAADGFHVGRLFSRLQSWADSCGQTDQPGEERT